MSDTEYEDGIIDNFKVENNRVSFKLNNKTYACFEKSQSGEDNEVAKDIKEIFLNYSDKKVAIEFYTNEKDNKKYHNLTKIDIAENQERTKEGPQTELVSKEHTPKSKEINGQAFGLACHLSQRMTSALGAPFEFEQYESRVKRFYKLNQKIRGELDEELQKHKE